LIAFPIPLPAGISDVVDPGSIRLQLRGQPRFFRLIPDHRIPVSPLARHRKTKATRAWYRSPRKRGQPWPIAG